MKVLNTVLQKSLCKTANNWRTAIVKDPIVDKWTLLERTVNMSSQRVQSFNYQDIVWAPEEVAINCVVVCVHQSSPTVNATFQTQDSRQPREHWTVTPWFTLTSHQLPLLIHLCHIVIREKEFFTGECKMREVKVTAIEHASVYLILLWVGHGGGGVITWRTSDSR